MITRTIIIYVNILNTMSEVKKKNNSIISSLIRTTSNTVIHCAIESIRFGKYNICICNDHQTISCPLNIVNTYNCDQLIKCTICEILNTCNKIYFDRLVRPICTSTRKLNCSGIWFYSNNLLLYYQL